MLLEISAEAENNTLKENDTPLHLVVTPDLFFQLTSIPEILFKSRNASFLYSLTTKPLKKCKLSKAYNGFLCELPTIAN